MDGASFLIPRPNYDLTPEKQTAFEGLYRSTEVGDFVDYRLEYPKWQYLSYLCDTKELVLHGSQDQSIGVVEPRQAIDKKEFSNQSAIYASTDGIFVIYFAILDRISFSEMTLFNSCLRVRMSADQISDPLYFFSITHSVLLQKPWCEGSIYILPRQSFEQEMSQEIQGKEIIFNQWISKFPTQPIAKLKVGPKDFPFLDQIHGHDNEKLVQLAAEEPGGFPWPEALMN